ncbi:MAG: PHP domain-containing protein [Anaerolineales bacterium]|nr:PHP domain-containing protein [Anaerolineales bacterium]
MDNPHPTTTIKVELHCHTYYSKDSLMEPQRLIQICEQRGIDRVAITDHNEIRGALEAAEIDPDRVIVGEEVKTTQGEFVAYFVKECVPSGLSPMEAIELLRDQGAFISVAHPFDTLRSGSWDKGDLEHIVPHVDAIEVFNARNWTSSTNSTAETYAKENELPGIAGSDAHAYLEVGRVTMIMPDFNNREGFRRALHTSRIVGGRSIFLVHLLSRYASLRKSLGWRPRGS